MDFYRFPNSATYGVLVESEASWGELDQETNTYSSPTGENLVQVLNSVKNAFEHMFGVEYVSSFHVLVLPSIEHPEARRQQHIVFLSARGRRWAQYVYQFSHELCHVMIPNDVAEYMRWFEEAICELASHYCLRRVSESWISNPPYANWKNYAVSFMTYSDLNMQDLLEIPDGGSFDSFIRKKLSTLINNPYLREINRLCAKHMIPIFEENPELWKDVPKLCLLPNEISFYEALETWKSLSDSKQSIEKIISLFSP